MRSQKKGALLLGLLCLWAVIVAYQFRDQPDPQRVPLTFRSGPAMRTADRGRPSLSDPAPLFTAKAQNIPRNPHRNIFAPLQFAHPPKRTIAKPHALPPPKVVAPPPPRGPSPEELAAAQAHKALNAYRVLGYAEKNGEPQAFLRKGSKLFIAGPGTMLEATIQVATVTEDAVTLLETHSHVEALLPYSPPRP